MIEEYETTEHLTSEEISRSISIMSSQLARFEAESVLLRAALARPLQRGEDGADVSQNQQAIEQSSTDKIMALLIGSDRDWIEERIADLEAKTQSITSVINKYRTLRSTKLQPDPPKSGLSEQMRFWNEVCHHKPIDIQK